MNQTPASHRRARAIATQLTFEVHLIGALLDAQILNRDLIEEAAARIEAYAHRLTDQTNQMFQTE